MAKKVFTIQNTGQIIVIEHNWRWRNIVVRLGDSEIGRFETLAPLKRRQLFKTKIGNIYIQYKQTLLYGSGFDVQYNNGLLTGSVNDPIQHWKTGVKTAIFLGLFNIVLGGIFPYTYSFIRPSGMEIVSFFAVVDEAYQIMWTISLYSVFFGSLVIILGLISWWRRSSVELAIAPFIFFADAALSVLILADEETVLYSNNMIVPLVVRAIIIVLMARGAIVAWKINQPHEKAKNSH